MTSYEVFIYLCLGDDIFCTLERIESITDLIIQSWRYPTQQFLPLNSIAFCGLGWTRFSMFDINHSSHQIVVCVFTQLVVYTVCHKKNCLHFQGTIDTISRNPEKVHARFTATNCYLMVNQITVVFQASFSLNKGSPRITLTVPLNIDGFICSPCHPGLTRARSIRFLYLHSITLCRSIYSTIFKLTELTLFRLKSIE